MSFEDGEGEEPSLVGEVRVVGETPKAIRCAPKGFKASGESYWVPKSVVHDNSEVSKNGDTGKLVVKQWYADREGL